MRLMSFALTTPQVRSRQKTVTRRLGWRTLIAGEVLQAVVKGQGLKKGEKVERIAIIRVEAVERERLDALNDRSERSHLEVIREGFPQLLPSAFVEMFCRHNGCTPETEVTRIEFSYVD